MSSITVHIEPYPINKQISYLQLYIDEFRLGATDCSVSVYEYTAEGQLLNVVRVYIEPELYKDWGKDDFYLVEIVIDKLGYVRKAI